jgi:transposase-like protein
MNAKFDARSLDHRLLQTLRQRAVAAVNEGCSVSQVAQVYRLNRRTVYRWVADFRRDGPQALLAKPITGRPKRCDANVAPKPTSSLKIEYRPNPVQGARK